MSFYKMCVLVIRAGHSRSFADLFNSDHNVRRAYIVGASFISFIVLSLLLIWCALYSLYLATKRRRIGSISRTISTDLGTSIQTKREFEIIESSSCLEVIQLNLLSDNSHSEDLNNRSYSWKRKCVFFVFMISCRLLLISNSYVLIKYGLGSIRICLKSLQSGTEKALDLTRDSEYYLKRMPNNLVELRQSLYDFDSASLVCFPPRKNETSFPSENILELYIDNHRSVLTEIDVASNTLFHVTQEALLSSRRFFNDMDIIVNRSEWNLFFWLNIAIVGFINLISILFVCHQVFSKRKLAIYLKKCLASVGTSIYFSVFSVASILCLSSIVFAIITSGTIFRLSSKLVIEYSLTLIFLMT